MKTTEKTAHIAEALKKLHECNAHVLDAMMLQIESEDGANKWYMKDYQPKADAVADFLKQMIGMIVDDNALTAATMEKEDWAM